MLRFFTHSVIFSTSIVKAYEYSSSASAVDVRRLTYVDVRQIAAETEPVLFLQHPPYVDVRSVNATCT